MQFQKPPGHLFERAGQVLVEQRPARGRVAPSDRVGNAAMDTDRKGATFLAGPVAQRDLGRLSQVFQHADHGCAARGLTDQVVEVLVQLMRPARIRQMLKPAATNAAAAISRSWS